MGFDVVLLLVLDIIFLIYFFAILFETQACGDHPRKGLEGDDQVTLSCTYVPTNISKVTRCEHVPCTTSTGGMVGENMGKPESQAKQMLKTVFLFDLSSDLVFCKPSFFWVIADKF